MSSGGSYPSRGRAARAYQRGVESARPGSTAHTNPYTHPKLRELFERGRRNELDRRRNRPGPPAP